MWWYWGILIACVIVLILIGIAWMNSGAPKGPYGPAGSLTGYRRDKTPVEPSVRKMANEMFGPGGTLSKKRGGSRW